MSSEHERRYTEKEVGQILRRAAKRQAASDGSLPGNGMTLAELQRVAGEVNISPDQIAAAAAELDAPSSGSKWLGVLPARQLERVVDGEMDELDWERTVSELRSAFGKRGDAERLGATYEWRAQFESTSNVDVSVTPRDGKTRITLRVDYAQGIMMGWMAGLVGTGTVGLVVGKILYRAHADVIAIVFGAVLPILMGAVGAWAATRIWNGMNAVKLNGILDRVSSRVSTKSPSAIGAEAQPDSIEESHHVQA